MPMRLSCEEILFFITFSCMWWWVLLCHAVPTCLTWILFGLPGRASSQGELFCSACSTLPFQPWGIHPGHQAASGCCAGFCSTAWLFRGPNTSDSLNVTLLSHRRRRGLFCPLGYLNVPSPLQWEQGPFVRCCETSFSESINKQTFPCNVSGWEAVGR